MNYGIHTGYLMTGSKNIALWNNSQTNWGRIWSPTNTLNNQLYTLHGSYIHLYTLFTQSRYNCLFMHPKQPGFFWFLWDSARKVGEFTTPLCRRLRWRWGDDVGNGRSTNHEIELFVAGSNSTIFAYVIFKCVCLNEKLDANHFVNSSF